MQVVCYKARHTNAIHWAKLEVYVRVKKRGDEVRFMTGDDVLDKTNRSMSKKSFEGMLKLVEHYHSYLLQNPFEFRKTKTLWLRPDGMIMLARLKKPEKDPHAIEVEKMFGPFGHSFTVDIQHARWSMKQFGIKEGNPSVAERTLNDIRAICSVLSFFQEHGLDVAALAIEIDQAMYCLTPREQQALRYYFGSAGEPVGSLEDFSRNMKVSRERGRQMILTIAKKIRRRIRWNRLRQKAGSTFDRTTADYS